MAGFLGSSSSGFLGGSSGGWPKPPSQELSPLQQQELLALLTMKPQGNTFWDDVRDGAGLLSKPVSWALRQISRPGYGIARAALYATDEDPNTSAGEGFYQGFVKAVPTGFGQVLEQNNILEDNDVWRGLAGFGLDVATDPTNLIYIGAAPFTGGASLSAIAAKNSMKAAALKAAIDAGDVAITKSTVPELMEAYKVLSEPTLYAKFGPQKLLAEQKLIRGYREAWGEKYPDELAARLDELGLQATEADPLLLRQAQSQALASQKSITRDLNRLQVKFAGVPLTPTHIGPLMAPKAPSLGRVAEGASLVNKVPVAGGLAQMTAKGLNSVFVGGAGDKTAWAAKMVGKHSAERLGDDYVRELRDIMKPFSKMKLEDQKEALRFATSRQGIVDANGVLDDEVLNEAVTKGWTRNADDPDKVRTFKLSKEQADYIRAYHDYGVKLQKLDEAFGVKYNGGTVWAREGKVYVPLPYTKFNTPLTSAAVRTMVSDAGYQFERKPGTTYETIEGLAKKLEEGGSVGRTKSVAKEDFNPSVLLMRRARRAAQKHADATAEDSLVRATGVPAYVPNAAKLTELNAKKNRLAEKLEKVRAKDDAYWSKWLQDEIAKRTQAKMNQYGNRKIERMKRDGAKAADIQRVKRNYAEVAKQEALVALGKNLDKHEAQLKRLEDSWDKVFRDMKKAAKTKNPVLTTPGFANYVAHKKKVMYTDFFGNKVHYHVPRTVGEMLSRKEMLVNSSEELQKFDTAFGKIISTWKIGATVVNLGYRVRNTLSDMWAQWLLGMNPAEMTHYYNRARVLMKQARKGDKRARQIINDAYDQGVLSGFFGGDIYQMSKAVDRGGTYRSKARKGNVPGLYLKGMSDMNKYVENQARMATYLWALRKYDGDATKAAELVHFGHFDYEDLTDIEREKFKKIIPFYTWTRKNVPFQVKSLASRPGRFSAFPKFALEMEYAASGGEGDYVPDYMNDMMAFKIPGGGYVNTPIGATDLMTLQNPMRLMQGIGPQFTIPLELASGKQFPSMNPIAGQHPRNPVAGGLTADLLGLLPGSNVGVTERFVNGEEMQGAGAAPWVGWLASQTPALNYLVNQRSDIKQAQRGPQPILGLPGYFTGITSVTPDQDQGELVAQMEFNDLMEKIIRGQRDENLLPESEQVEPSEYQARVNALIRSIYTRG